MLYHPNLIASLPLQNDSAVDESGMGNNGVVQGTASYVSMGSFGRGVDMPGTFGNNFYIPDSASTSIGGAQSFSATIILDALGSGATIASKVVFSGAPPRLSGILNDWLFYVNSSNVLCLKIYDSAGVAYIGRSGGTISTGTYYTVEWSYDNSGTNGGIKLFINGGRSDTADLSSGTFVGRSSNSAGNTYIGFGDGGSMDGRATRPTLWNKCLADTDMARLAIGLHPISS